MRAFTLFLIVLLASTAVLGHKKTAAPAQSAAAAALAKSTTGTVRVLVGFNVETPIGVQSLTDEGQTNAIAASRATFMSKYTVISPASGEALTPGINVTHQYNNFPFAAMDVDASALAALEADDDASSVQLDEVHKASLSQARPLVGAVTTNAAGITGAGQYVAVLDTGYDVSHVFLQGQFDPTLEACFSTPNAAAGVKSNCPNGQATQTGAGASAVGRNCPPTVQGCEHGTHVAGIVAGKATTLTNGAQIAGIAPGAKLILINVFQTYGAAICGAGTPACIGASTSDIVAGLDYVFSLRARFPIAAASMSLGGGGSTTQCDAQQAAYKRSIDALKTVGIATLIASGNDANPTVISSPACISSAVSVGSTTKTDTVSSFSNGNRFLTLYAPGSDIVSSVPNTAGTTPGTALASLSGTSMATPAASGVFALLRQKYGALSAGGPTVDGLVNLLKATGRNITDTRNGVTTTRVLASAAVGTTVTTATTATTATSTSTSTSRSTSTSTSASRSTTSATRATPETSTSAGQVRPGFGLIFENDEFQLFKRIN